MRLPRDARVVIVVDRHEPEEIPARLRELGVPVEIRSIQPGDYVVGEVAVERKTVRDFFASLVRKRLFEQVARLRETYPVPIVLVEGDLAAVAEHANPRAFWGAILALGLDERVPVLFAPDAERPGPVRAADASPHRTGAQSRWSVPASPRRSLRQPVGPSR